MVILISSISGEQKRKKECLVTQRAKLSLFPGTIHHPSAIMGPGYCIGLFVIIVAGIVHFVAWIGALIRSAKMQTLGWFVAVLLLGNLGTLVYAITGPSNQPMMAAAYPPQGYPPQ